MFKRFFLMVTMLSLFISSISFSTIAKDYDFSDEYISMMMEQQKDAVTAFQKIHEALDIVDPSHEKYPNYPIEYSGSYYDDGFLYILLTENTYENQQKYLSFVENKSVIKFVSSDFSYNDLYNEMNLIHDKYSNELPLTSISVNIPNNEINVGIYDLEVLDTIPQTFSTLPINFIYEEQMSPSTIIGGAKITKDDGSSSGTMTIYGKWNNKNVVLTAGHCFSNLGDKFYLNNKYLGSCIYYKYSSYSFYDYGFIEVTNNNFNITQKVLTANPSYSPVINTLATSSSYFPVGSAVSKNGSFGGQGTGKITAVNSIVTYTDKTTNKKTTLYGMSFADFVSGTGKKGDSGGPIYCDTTLYGIYSGDNATDNTDATYFIFSPIYGASGFSLS